MKAHIHNMRLRSKLQLLSDVHIDVQRELFADHPVHFVPNLPKVRELPVNYST